MRFMCLTLAFLLPVAVWAEQPVTTAMLDNGMEVVVIEDHRAPVAVHMVWYKVGSADEPAGTSGVAHFLEHMMFKATDTLKTGEFSEIVSANGGTDNAFTSYDYTAYFQRVAADRLPLMMEMEASRMNGLLFDQHEMETEREVVKEERAQRTDSSPGALFREQRQAAQYLNHHYGIPIIGWRHEIDTLDIADLEAFYRAHYGPNNAVLVVAGDVDPAQVIALAETHYGAIPANPAITPRDRPQDPPQRAPRRVVYTDERVAQPWVVRSYLVPERDPGDQGMAAKMYMLAEVLGGSGATSFLGEKLQFDTQTAVYTNASYDGLSLDDTTFGLVIVPTPDVSLKQAEAALDAAIADFMEQGVPEGALERLKTQLRASQIYAQDDVGTVARRYGAALTSGLTVEDVQAWPDLLQTVTQEDIMEVAQTVFDLNNSVTGWLQTLEESQ